MAVKTDMSSHRQYLGREHTRLGPKDCMSYTHIHMYDKRHSHDQTWFLKPKCVILLILKYFWIPVSRAETTIRPLKSRVDMSSFGLTNGESQGVGLPVGLTNGRWGGGLGIMLGKILIFYQSFWCQKLHTSQLNVKTRTNPNNILLIAFECETSCFINYCITHLSPFFIKYLIIFK